MAVFYVDSRVSELKYYTISSGVRCELDDETGRVSLKCFRKMMAVIKSFVSICVGCMGFVDLYKSC